jgi:hypothetical protein
MKTNKITILTICVVLLTLNSCRKLGFCKDEKLSLERTNYTGKEIKTNGFYYAEIDENDKGFYELICLYKNGIVMIVGADYLSKEEMVDMVNLLDGTNESDIKYIWGIYKIEDCKI